MSRPHDSPALALLGAGEWGQNLGRCFGALGALRLVVDPHNPRGLEKLRQRVPALRTSTSLHDALEDPTIEAVAIVTPSSTHFELASAALSAGKHVLVEKPLCLRLSEAEALVAQASKCRKTLMVGHLLQYHPGIVRLRALVEGGALGRLLTINSTRLNLGKLRSEENVLWSFAPHDISVIMSLVGNRLPEHVRCTGAAYLRAGVVDSTLTAMRFADGVSAQLHVSWLNPFKEQKLTVVGSEGMAVFDDTKAWPEKLTLYRNYLSAAADRQPTLVPTPAEPVPLDETEPLLAECAHFLEACRGQLRPRTDGHEAVRVLSVLDMAERSLNRNGELERSGAQTSGAQAYFAHETAVVAADAEVGAGTKVWHFSQVMPGAKIGARCNLGQNVNVAGGAVLGDGVKVQNNVSIYGGVHVEDDVFLGPSCVLTNVSNPRAALSRRGSYEPTRIRRGATIGANATIVCGITLGRHCFVAAGAVVVADVPDYALMMGNPARQRGWMSRHGQRLQAGPDGTLVCPQSGLRYRELEPGQLRCLDVHEDAALPEGSE
jgi:UDP-2-acetamido-3-amino-2,3-dideoxy-glucuronate N-acetyltransferase